jgi:hypothetical protein
VEKDRGILIQVPTTVPEVVPSPSKAPAAGPNKAREAEGQATRLLAGMEDAGLANSTQPTGNMRKSISSPEAVDGDDREGKDRSSEEYLQIIIPVETKGTGKGMDQDRDSNRDRRTDYPSPSEPVLTPRPPVSTLVLSLEPPISPSKQTGEHIACCDRRTRLLKSGPHTLLSSLSAAWHHRTSQNTTPHHCLHSLNLCLSQPLPFP